MIYKIFYILIEYIYVKFEEDFCEGFLLKLDFEVFYFIFVYNF